MFFFHCFPHTAAKAWASDNFFDMCYFFTRGCRSPKRLEKRPYCIKTNISLRAPNILFYSKYLSCVSKMAVSRTRVLRLERQAIPNHKHFPGVYVLLHYLPHTAAKARASDDFFGMYILLFNSYLYTGLQRPPKAWEKANLYIIKAFSKGSKRPYPF